MPHSARPLLIAGILAFQLIADTCLAAPAEVPAEPDPDKAAAIEELMAITGARINEAELSRSFSQQLISVLQANNTTLTPDAVQLINAEVDRVIAEQLASGDLQRRMHRIYARYFTLEELNGLIAFNRSDIGRKANRVMPVLMRESMSAAQEWSEEIGPVISSRVQKRLAQEGIKIGR